MPKPVTTIAITPMAFQELKRRLELAGHADAVSDDALRLHGVGLTLTPLRKASNTNIEIGSLLASKSKEGAVELSLNGERTQMDLPKAREVVGMLQAAIEAAVSDQLLFQFLTTKVGLSEDAAATALIDFRELRQGSRGVLYPH